MLLAVVGSTNIRPDQAETARAMIHGVLTYYCPQLVISGGAAGVDTIAEREAFILNIPEQIYRPENNRWEPHGFKERNLKIAMDCTHLLCIRTSQSTTYGSGWTADRAEEMGKTVWRATI